MESHEFAALTIRLADLTRLSRDNGGKSPFDDGCHAIDGRRDVGGHGVRAMPVWGIAFQDPGSDSDQEALVRSRILDLIGYLETLQRTNDS